MRKKLFKRGVVFGCCLLFVDIGVASTVAETVDDSGLQKLLGDQRVWYYVDDEPGEGPGNPSEDYIRIQDAIDNASSGDVIFVYSGIYRENIVIRKEIDLLGESRFSTIIDAYNPRIPGVFINSSNVTVKRFTIKNSSEASGILIQEKIQKIRYITIQECDIKNNGGNGVSLDGALLKPPGIEKRSIPSIDSVIIHGCRITNNGGNGVYSQEADVERITSCNISDNRGNGIHIESSPVTIMMENHIERNGRCGIYIKGSHTAWLGIVFVQENHIANNAEEGLHFADYALAVFVNRNTFSENNKRGYQLVADLYGPPPLPWYVHNNQWEPKKFYARLWRIIRLPCS